MNSFLSVITNDKFKGIMAIICAVVMCFTPDNIDKIIETILTLFGISTLVIKPKNET